MVEERSEESQGQESTFPVHNPYDSPSIRPQPQISHLPTEVTTDEFTDEESTSMTKSPSLQMRIWGNILNLSHNILPLVPK